MPKFSQSSSSSPNIQECSAQQWSHFWIKKNILYTKKSACPQLISQIIIVCPQYFPLPCLSPSRDSSHLDKEQIYNILLRINILINIYMETKVTCWHLLFGRNLMASWSGSIVPFWHSIKRWFALHKKQLASFNAIVLNIQVYKSFHLKRIM